MTRFLKCVVDVSVAITADRRRFDKAQHLGQIAWLPDFVAA